MSNLKQGIDSLNNVITNLKSLEQDVDPSKIKEDWNRSTQYMANAYSNLKDDPAFKEDKRIQMTALHAYEEYKKVAADPKHKDHLNELCQALEELSKELKKKAA